jgi:triosephosphate isomerase
MFISFHLISGLGIPVPLICPDPFDTDCCQGLGMEVCSQNVGKTDAGAFTGGTDREIRMQHLHAEIRI